MPRHTTVQAASRQQVMYGLKEPTSSMEPVMSRALRYQKYDVGELFAHSFTGVKRRRRKDDLLVLHVTHSKYLKTQLSRDERQPSWAPRLRPQLRPQPLLSNVAEQHG
ncbi:hypothetical protein EYF80_064957 [Liparis tanakae]|uniref:Uncharacterized protein n=1 Tax=Liparis tanakae TaxID=230148 RepID=A0A4Z2E7J9_9TELE|nr:hypothetical protein EYF80_064957 [Liparis tanakae]